MRSSLGGGSEIKKRTTDATHARAGWRRSRRHRSDRPARMGPVGKHSYIIIFEQSHRRRRTPRPRTGTESSSVTTSRFTIDGTAEVGSGGATVSPTDVLATVDVVLFR